MILFIVVFGTYANLYMFRLITWEVRYIGVEARSSIHLAQPNILSTFSSRLRLFLEVHD